VEFSKILDYDNKCFVSTNFLPREKFLRQQIRIPGGAAYVALDDTNGNVIGFACRRPAEQPRNHLIGPVYADSRNIAQCLTAKLCQEVTGDDVTITQW
jgi:Acetyltransferase (GNAT) domain